MLTPTAFPSPGYLGLNKQQESIPLGPEWAVVADNGVIHVIDTVLLPAS